MTKGEMARILAVLAAAFPRFEVDDVKVQVWHEMLGDLDYHTVNIAIKRLIMEQTFPPSIAEVRKTVAAITNPQLATGSEAWGEVTRAIRNYGYYREEEALESMSPATAKVVRYMGWRDICLSEEPSGVTRGQFLKMYEQVAGREAQEKLLPAGLQEQIRKLYSGKDLRLIEGGRNAK